MPDAAIIGWEKNGAWVGPDYYPPVEGDEAFKCPRVEVNIGRDLVSAEWMKGLNECMLCIG
ncbi:MAG: hypothetical protein ACFFCS_10095 [Candidatus Hodarchaeota archaeon]